MTQTIRLSKSTISEADKAAVLAVLDSEYLGMGTTVQQFELELQTYLGTDREGGVCQLRYGCPAPGTFGMRHWCGA